MESESRTAIGAAMQRALHQWIDGEVKILEDPVILKLLEPEHLVYLQDHLADYGHERLRRLRSHIVLRSRYAEDRVKKAYERGIRQMVLLGAGLDTYAYRQPEWAHDLTIIEADHPASQAYKLQQLERAGICRRENQIFLSLDLDKGILSSAFQSVLHPGKQVFISWLGVMVYLRWDTIDAIFRFVADLPKGSEFIFTFSPTKFPGWPDPVAQMAAAAGEPWITYIDPPELTDKLKQYGFTDVYFLEPAEARQLYYMDTRIKLPPPQKSSIVRVIV